jgi:hypothetical protein
MDALDELREHGGMTWVGHEHGWIATPATVVSALVSDGFEECKREMTTSRRDGQPAGGLWQGINPRTRSAASVIWVSRPATQAAMVFIEIDGETVSRMGRDPDEEEGGEA